MPDFFHINGATIVLIKGIEDPNQLFLKSCAFSLTWSNMHTPKLYLIIIYKCFNSCMIGSLKIVHELVIDF